MLSPLPCWKDLSDDAYRARVAELVEEIEEEAAVERQQTGRQVLGVKAILAQDPLGVHPNFFSKKMPLSGPSKHLYMRRRSHLHEPRRTLT
ncbi:MAG TPA: hypothetical protein VGX68_23120 [Thermoanaerobaculia bacterium]|nr:hypothetical protein [Thermoanaerobaculia bacterium]